MRVYINSAQVWRGLSVTSTSPPQIASMSDDEHEISGRRKRVGGLQLGPRKRPYVHHLYDGFIWLKQLIFLKDCYRSTCAPWTSFRQDSLCTLQLSGTAYQWPFANGRVG